MWQLESDKTENCIKYSGRSLRGHMVAARAHLIGICSEAPMQPLFQLYILLSTCDGNLNLTVN